MVVSAKQAALQPCPDTHKQYVPALTAGWLRQWEQIFLPKETTVAESPNQASNLGPYNYQADALAACYCLPTLVLVKNK